MHVGRGSESPGEQEVKGMNAGIMEFSMVLKRARENGEH